MQVVLNADQKSYVQQALVKGDVQDLTYLTAPSYPIVSKANHELQPFISFTGSPDNNSHTFNITRGSGLHYLGRIKFSWSKAFLESEAPTFSILNIIRQVQWVSNGQPIQTMDGEAIKVFVMNSEASIQENVYRYARALDPITEEPYAAAADVGATTYVSYLPIFASWYTSIEKALNANELDQLQFTLTYKSSTESGMSSQMTNFTAKFENFTYMPDSSTYNIMLAKDFSKPIIMQTFSTFTERRMVTADQFNNAAVTSIQVTSDVVQAVYKTHIFIAKTNILGQGVGTTANSVYGCPYVPISSVSISMGGDYYVSKYTKSMLNYEQAWRGNSAHSVGPVDSPNAATPNPSTTRVSPVYYNENQCFTIDWSLGCKRDDATGLASMINLNKPVYDINVSPVALKTDDTPSSYWVFLVHEYWQILTVQEGTRSLAIAASV